MLELELKYLSAQGLNGRKPIKKALQHAGVLLDEPVTQEIIDTYYDSDGSDLCNAGWTLRIRRTGKQTKATLKQLGTAPRVFERRELSKPVSPDLVNQPHISSEIANQLVPGLLGQDINLNPLFRQVTQRRNRHLTHPSFSNVSVIWSEDRVRMAGDKQQQYIEHEFELSGPHTPLLGWISQHLDKVEQIYPSLMSKFKRGYYYLGPGWTQLAGLTDSSATCSARTWQELATQTFDRNIKGLLHSAAFAHEAVHIEGVHQMRIWVRRTRAALTLFRKILPQKTRKQLSNNLRRLTQLSTPVRDADVALKKIWKTHPPGKKAFAGTSVGHYYEELVQTRAAAHADLRSALNQDIERVNALRTQLQPLISSDMSILTGFQTQLLPRVRAILRKGSGLDKGQISPTALHQLRKQCRSLGYQLDIMASVQTDKLPLEPIRKELAHLLVYMGNHQDAVVAKAQIAKQIRSKRKGNTKELKRLKSEAERRAKKAHKNVRRSWQRFNQAVGVLASPEYP